MLAGMMSTQRFQRNSVNATSRIIDILEILLSIDKSIICKHSVVASKRSLLSPYHASVYGVFLIASATG